MKLYTRIACVGFGCLLVLGCAGQAGRTNLKAGGERQATAVGPTEVQRSSGEVVLGEPLAVSVSFSGEIYLADGAPGRLLIWDGGFGRAQEFQPPTRDATFYPTDLCTHGFFVYAVNETGRSILRFDRHGAYRDVLINFRELAQGRRVSPFGIDVDDGGRIAVTDVENHQVLIYDSYLDLELAFGNYGSFPGQFDTPQGVAFTKRGEIVVADTGNRRVQVMSPGGAALRSVPAVGEPSPLRAPRRAVVDDAGKMYVADPEAGRVFVFDSLGTLVGAYSSEDAQRFEPSDVGLSRDGSVYVTDIASRALFVFKAI